MIIQSLSLKTGNSEVGVKQTLAMIKNTEQSCVCASVANGARRKKSWRELHLSVTIALSSHSRALAARLSQKITKKFQAV
jgi:ribosomal protein L30E